MKDFVYDEMYRNEAEFWWFKARRKIILDKIEQIVSDKKDVKILDAGCGCGYILQFLQRYGEVFGMDFSPKAIEYTKSHFDGVVKKGDLNGEIPFEDNSFDIIISLDVLEHVEKDDIALQSLHRVLKSGGKCILTVPAHKFLWSYHDHNHMHIRRYEKKEFEDKLKAANFNITYLTWFDAWLYIPVVIIRMIKEHIINTKDMASDGRMPGKIMNRILYNIFASESWFIKRNIRFMQGVSLLAVIDKE